MPGRARSKGSGASHIGSFRSPVYCIPVMARQESYRDREVMEFIGYPGTGRKGV